MRTAIVTGGAQNIGKGIAAALIKEGYHCLVVDKNAYKLQETVAGFGDNCSQYVADVGDLAQINKLVDWLKAQHKQVDVLINNVGYNTNKALLELEPQDIVTSSRVNLEGPFYLTSLLAKAWVSLKVKGDIIFISSTHSQVIRTHPLYSAAKAAIEMFTKEAALELATYRIRVNAVAPGPVEDAKEIERNDLVPLGFNQQPQDIGEAVAFLLSDKARFITGQTLIVDGGFSLAHTHYWLKHKKNFGSI